MIIEERTYSRTDLEVIHTMATRPENILQTIPLINEPTQRNLHDFLSKNLSDTKIWYVYSEKKSLWGKKKDQLVEIYIWAKHPKILELTSFSDQCLIHLYNKEFYQLDHKCKAHQKVLISIKNLNWSFIPTFCYPYDIHRVARLKVLGFEPLGINTPQSMTFTYTLSESGESSNLKNMIGDRYVSVDNILEFKNLPHSKAFMRSPLIDSEHLHMKPFHANDTQALMSMMQINDIAREFGGPYNREMAHNVISYTNPKGYLEGTFICFVISHKTSNTIIGSREIYFDTDDGIPITQGYIIPEARGYGYHQVGLMMVMGFIAGCGYPAIAANCSLENKAARHVLNKLGFDQVDNISGRLMHHYKFNLGK